MPQLFAFLFGLLSFGYIHCDADVITHFARTVVMSYGAQKSDGAVGMTNSEFTDVEIRS